MADVTLVGAEPARVPDMTEEYALNVVTNLAPSGVARQRVFGVLLRHLTMAEEDRS